MREEAVLEASGHGLARPMTGFSVAVAPPGTTPVELDVGTGYTAALAALGVTDLDVTVVDYPTAVTDTPR